MVENKQSIIIGLLWHSPNSANLGVGALTVSNIAIIKETAERANLKPIFKIFGFVDDRAIYVSGDDISVVRLNGKQVFLPWSGLSEEILKCDIMLDIGGGDSFTDIYGLKRFIFLTLSKFRVLANNVPLILSPQTIGPFKHWYTRIIAGWLSRKASMIFARDQLSYDYLINVMEVGAAQVALSSDVAFALPYSKPETKKLDQLNIGINISGLLFNGGYTGKNEFGLTLDYPNLMRQIIAYFINENCKVHLIAHVICENFAQEDDYAVSKLLADEFPEVIVISPFSNPIEAKTAIAKMDLFMGARMHACIAALSSGVPVIPMAYSRKFGGLFGALGYNHTLDCLSLNMEEALNHIKEAYLKRGQLKSDAGKANGYTQEKLENYRSSLLKILEKIKNDT